MILRTLFNTLILSMLFGCSGTTVVLVPDANGKVGQVDLTTKAGTTRLTKANESAEASKSDKAPSQTEILSETQIKDMFAETLAKEPTPPAHFIFHFASGSAELPADSKEGLEQAKAAVQSRNSCDISVIGHSDTVGNNQINEGISLKRADSVITALVDLGIDKNCIDRRYYGENDLAKPTADNVDEPLNRRVEIEIR